jgi:hypothetical protein
MTDLTRFTYLINQCLKFLWTRDQQEEIQRLGNALAEENERLREANRWIPVSERLPEADLNHPYGSVEVIALNGDEYVSPAWVILSKTTRTPYGTWAHFGEELTHVTHWRALPEPRKEGEKGGDQCQP